MCLNIWPSVTFHTMEACILKKLVDCYPFLQLSVWNMLNTILADCGIMQFAFAYESGQYSVCGRLCILVLLLVSFLCLGSPQTWSLLSIGMAGWLESHAFLDLSLVKTLLREVLMLVPFSCPLDLPDTQPVGRPALPSDICMAGMAVPPPAASGRTNQSPGHWDHRCSGWCHQRLWWWHDTGVSRLQAYLSGQWTVCVCVPVETAWFS